MIGNFDSGNFRIAYIGNLPIYISNIEGFYPRQEMKEMEMVQGGPRTVVYEIGKKTIEGSISMPLYINKDGVIDEGCKEILRCADYPGRNFNLIIDRGIMHESLTANEYDDPKSNLKHRRMTFECCVVKKLTINVPTSGSITMQISIVALPEGDDTKINPYYLPTPNSGMMMRQCSYADCSVTLGGTLETGILKFKENVQEFELNIENNTEGLYLLGQHDYASYLILGKTNINGQWTEAIRSEEWADEADNYNHGGYCWREGLKFRIADVSAYIDDVLYEPQEQPLGSGLLKKKTNFKATFEYGWVDENQNLIFKDLI